MTVSKLIFLVVLANLTACGEPGLMIDIQKLLLEQDCSSASSISGLGDMPYLGVVESLGAPSASSRIEFSGLKGSDALLPEFYLPLVSHLRTIPKSQTLLLEERSWKIRDKCVLTIWYELSGEILTPISNIYYDAEMDF